MKSFRSITLVEVLLISIAFFIVAGLLGSFLGFGCGLPPDIARKHHAKNDTIEIANAVAAYHAEYGRFPWTNADILDVGGPGLLALVGTETNLNPRQIVFLEPWNARKGKGGLTNGVYVDPWGSPYKIKLDIDGDQQLTNVGPAFALRAKLSKMVAVWNDPGYHTDRSDPKKKKKRAVTSWD